MDRDVQSKITFVFFLGTSSTLTPLNLSPAYFLDFGSDTTALLKLSFSVCVALTFYYGNFTDFS